ncbi:MAG: hypothetical protein E6R07_07310 [Nevskiaceae bacterium]|nr:MAG: hypothetical protein E6R07_07310 [Nevskiaceae bacterium]
MIDSVDHGRLAGSELESWLGHNEVISQIADQPDRDFAEVTWSQYGVVATDEIAVTARCGPLAYFCKAPSYLTYPVMADRIFGTDVRDVQLGLELADHLWVIYGDELAAQARRIRGGRAS